MTTANFKKRRLRRHKEKRKRNFPPQKKKIQLIIAIFGLQAIPKLQKNSKARGKNDDFLILAVECSGKKATF